MENYEITEQEKDEIIEKINNCSTVSDLEEYLESIENEKLQEILLENALDLKSEMEAHGNRFNAMKTYKTNLTNVVEDYYDDIENFI